MGTVFRALDPRLGRSVALKLLKLDTPSLQQRFIAEARAQARIHHDHVCRVYEAGEADGEPYIVMQFIDGEPLPRLRERLTLEQQVKLMREVASAVHEAHRLGMIHRDIKPGNILVEEREDGGWKPYIMDFGLVRQVADRGQTQTGEALGTPAYMSPEQAAGELQTLDRRTDVYSLGATLYDVIAGHPPFVSEHPWKLFVLVTQEDAPPLGKVEKGVPKDLETIVMKCLERDPARRYESARALAEDLQRALDGEPIQARRASLRYVLWKKARKHRLLTALLLVLALGTLGLVGMGVAAQRHAARQARIARELGEGVKETELFLRAAYGLPVHDVERERDVVRAKLAEISEQMKAAGKAGEAPGHDALGRGYLALGEPERAREHLEKALAEGDTSTDLEYALGQALGELFRHALDETRRTTNEAERKKKIEALNRGLRDPALQHLRAAVGSRIEVPEYAEGLIALYEGKNEEAIAKAKAAYAKAPWMYEPKKLEGDALYAEGSKYRHDAAFDYEKMKEYFDPAAQAYRVAAEMGSSDPDVHRAECELWEKMGWAAASQGLPTEEPFSTAEAACARAVLSSSRDGRALVQRALVLLARVHVLGENASEDSLPWVDEALRAAEAGRRARPTDVMAHYAVAQAHYLRTRVLYQLGQSASMEQAITSYEEVLELDPSFTWAANELGDSYLEEAKHEIAGGRDAVTLLRIAIRQYERTMALDSRFALPAGGRLDALTVWLEAELNQGRSGDEPLQALSAAQAELARTSTSPWLVAFWKARAHRLQGLHDFANGGDPRAPLATALETIGAFSGDRSTDYWFLKELALCHLLEAEYALREGQDAAPALAKAREAVSKAAALKAQVSPSLRLLAGRIELATLRAEERHGALAEGRFQAALADLRPLLSKPGTDSAPFQVAAELHAEHATILSQRGLSPEEDVRSGLTLADEALAKNPRNAQALVAQGRLHLLRARMKERQGIAH
jgi:serine/threonine-protein kinase